MHSDMAKYITYCMPVECIGGSLSGRQDTEYASGGVKAYALPIGTRAEAIGYRNNLIAMHNERTRRNYFQVRTRFTVNVSAVAHRNMAIMGGAGALFAALVRDKSTLIYAQCVAAVPKGETLRSFIVPLISAGLSDKSAQLMITEGVYIVNPWVSSATPNVPVSSAILDKFAGELSNS